MLQSNMHARLVFLHLPNTRRHLMLSKKKRLHYLLVQLSRKDEFASAIQSECLGHVGSGTGFCFSEALDVATEAAPKRALGVGLSVSVKVTKRFCI